MNKKFKIGITLSGGGARGIAHIGVLQALESAAIFPEIISGCSAGALIGALYAEGFSPHQIFGFIEKKSLYSLVRMGMPNKGMMELAYFKQILVKNIQHDSFEGLKKPFFVAVTNLNTGKSEIISQGKLIDFVIASAALPLLFKPIQIDDFLYVDGGILNNLPVEPIREQCRILIGVNVNPIKPITTLTGITNVGLRVLDLSVMVNMESRMRQCDFLIEPLTDHFSIFSIKDAHEIYSEGYEAGLKIIPQLSIAMNKIK